MRFRPFAFLAAFLVAVLALGQMLPAFAAPVLPDPDPGDVTAELGITKSASATEVGPGDTVVYTIQVQCSAISVAGCEDAITTDVVPEPFVVQDVVPSGPNDAAEPTIDGQNVRVDWTEPLAGGGEGMTDNTTGQVQITVQVPEDVSYDYNGQTVTNDAWAEASNATDVDASADVVINVPLDLDTTPTKSFDPTQALAAAGTPVTASLTGANDSNATVDTLTIQDPVDPTASPNPFTYLGFTGFGAVTPPEGAEGDPTYEVYVDGAWVTCDDAACSNVDPTTVQGTRVTWTGAIPPGATGSVDLELETTDEAAAVDEDTVVNNTVQSEVTLDGESATNQASADFTLQANTIDVSASKVFSPDLVIAGESSTVTIGGTNDSPFAIDSMTITEPSEGSFPADYTFGGFSGGITYPAGATSATVTYQPSGEQVPVDNGGIPAEPAGGWASVTSFSVTFEGEIEAGATATIPFDVDTDPDLGESVDLPTTVNNEVAVEGENDGATGDATADDDLYIYDEVIEPYVDKQVRPSQIIANPGEVVTVSLQGGTTERPNPPENPDGTTGDADQIVIQDPLDPIEGNAWWNAFDLDSITQTPIPSDAELTVYYYDTSDPTGGPDGDGWKVLTGPVAGPNANFSYDVPDDISEVAGGVRFVYDYTGDSTGFAPGTDLAPNFTSTLRPADDGRYESPAYNTDPEQPNTFIPNCAQTDATSPTDGVDPGHAEMDPADCPEIEIIPLDGPGVGDLIEKEYGTSSGGGNKSIRERSGETIPSTLHWSTGGYSGFETVEITDVADPETTPITDSVYDAFNLIRVEPINDGNDPYIKYDQVTGVDLWIGGAWVEAENNPCPEDCDGIFPGMDLTPDEQEAATSVRLTFAESPTRAETGAGDLDAPPVGSGVARSIDNDRNVTLTWQIRDEKRSDQTPVLAVDVYNLTDAGVVRNTARATGFPADGDPVTDQDFDDVVITNVPITTTTDKTWEGGPLGVPAQGTPATEYPLSQMTVTTTNTTPAMVDQLQITDPAPGSTGAQDPFDYFNLNNFAAITVPEGATDTTVTITCLDGAVNTYTPAEALDLTPQTMPCAPSPAGDTEVASVQVLFDGRIVTTAQGVLSLDLRLRATHRDTGAPITVDDSPIVNTAEGVVADVDALQPCPPEPGDRRACDQGTAPIELQDADFGINANKSIEPAAQKEGDYSPVTVTIGMQNTGPTRPYIDEIEDDDPTFWNAMDFVQMDPSWSLPTPVEHVQACYLTGGDFTAANVETGLAGDEGGVGGDWTCQEIPGGGPPFEDGDLTLDQAREFIDSAPAGDIHGLRFTFMAGGEDGWANPVHPNIQIPFQVERREELRTGGPVPTTRSDQEVAPGEESAGVFVDTVDAHGTSVLVGTDTRLEADASAQDNYTHEHLTVGVEVDKTPAGQVQPGAVIPFTLTYTNTGESPLTNPVFTDVLPSDAEGNQLIFDPDAAPGSTPYSFELTGDAPAPPNGDPLPTTSPPIEITEDGDTITFAMPEGTVLEPGQTYTITIELMLRPGLTPDDVVTNTDTVIADEPFDPANCAPNYDEETGECWDDTSVSPVRVAALSTVKKVQADVPVEEEGIPEVWLDRSLLPEGSDLPDDYCDTAADADGFYRAPCVPVTYPGDTETWRFTITNSGTLPIDELISIDDLPHTGDTGVIVDLPRDSEWTPTFANELELVDSTGTPIADIEQQAFYSPTHDPCTAEIENPPGTCPDGAWLPYDASVDPTIVAALKVQLDFPEGELFQPGDSVTLQAKTTTTPSDRSDSSFPVAWNTVATGGVSNDNGTRAQILASEGRKVGITYPTGPIQLQKTVSGEGAAYAPDSFTVQPTCTIDPDGDDVGNIDEVTLTPGADPVVVDGLPWGAECTATETDQGQADQTINTVVVDGTEPDESVLIDVENVFTLGDLSVTKAVTSEAVDVDGNPLTYGPFQVAVSCTYLGNEVWAEGYDASNPMEATIEDGDTVTFTGLPTGAECTVTEPDDADAAAVNITPEQPVEIVGLEDGEEPVQVDVENAFNDGSLHLLKEVEGPALENDPSLADGPFVFTVSCTLTDATRPEGEVVYDGEITLPADDNVDNDDMDYQIDNLPTGAVCDISETDNGGATTSNVDPEQITVGDGTTAEVTATNTFNTGGMAVTKAVDNGGAVDQDGNSISYDGPYEMTVTCTYRGIEVWGDGFTASPMVNTIADGETWQIDGLPIGAECVTEETDDAGAASNSIDPADPITIDANTDPTQVVTVTNDFTVGSLELTKESTGDALTNNPDLANGPFRFRVTCTLTDPSHPDGAVVYDGPVTITPEVAEDGTVTANTEQIDNLPTGAVCGIEETLNGGATSSTVDPSEVTIDDGGPDAPVTVTATNVFEVGTMSVTKSVETDAVDQDGNPISYGPFEVAVTCRSGGGTVVGDGYTESPMEHTIAEGETWTITGLPVGARCTTEETDTADAATTVIAPEEPVVIEPDSTGEVQEVSVTNTYDVGSLHLRKFVPEQVREFPISEGPFTFSVTCTLTDASHPDGTVVYEDDDIVLPDEDNVDNDVMDYQVDNIAAGAVCAVEETDDGAANAHIVTPQQVTISADENHEPETKRVVVTNLFGAGEVTVTKAIEGPGADLYGAGPFEVTVECTYTDVNGDEQPLNTPGGATRELSEDNDYTATYDPLLIGSNCTIEETATGGANSSVITDADGNEVSEFTVRPVPNTDEPAVEPMEFEVTNTFDTGAVRVRKEVVGPGSGAYDVRLACTYDVDGTATDVDIPGGATRTLEPGAMVTRYVDLPAGATCTLTETDDGGADSTTITPNDGDPSVGVVTVADGGTVKLDVENVFEPAGTGPDDDGGDDGGDLPETGADGSLLPLLIGGLLALVAGLILVLRSRRTS